jgi:hypothetical protein
MKVLAICMVIAGAAIIYMVITGKSLSSIIPKGSAS